MPELLPPPQTIVVFGASGDLSRRKIIPALYNLARDGLLPEQYAVVGYAPDPWDTTDFVEFARQSVAGFSRSSLRRTPGPASPGTSTTLPETSTAPAASPRSRRSWPPSTAPWAPRAAGSCSALFPPRSCRR